MTDGWCEQCGLRRTEQVHADCMSKARLDPPRWCADCGRRMVVQVVPTGWTARCVEHGERSSAR